MQVNLNCNQPRPQFGMAFRRPNDAQMNVFTERLFNNASEYTGQIIRKGLKQFDTEQAQLTRFDTRFNAENESMEVIENSTGKVVEKIMNLGTQTGFDTWGDMTYPGRKWIASIFNPKKFLPKEIYLAGELAKKYEAQAIKKENLTKNLF